MRIAPSLALAFGLLALAGDANAERRDCEVVFVRAPDAARLVIESWLQEEPRCSGTIELRVIETESGSLYLIAQRPDGRIHEREVPDAQSAGVLVASWVADDWTSTPPEDEDGPPPPVEPRTTSAITMAPGMTDTAPLPASAARSTGRWFGVTGMIQTEGQGGAGVRFEMDLLGGRASKWTLGIAAMGVASHMAVHSVADYGTLETVDLRAMIVAARTWRLGSRWNVRWSAGLGPMYTDATAMLVESDPLDVMYATADGVTLVGESSVTIAREMFDHRWAITAGPAATIISQQLEGSADIARNKLELMFMLGARYRL